MAGKPSHRMMPGVGAKHVVWAFTGIGFLLGSCAFSSLYGKHWGSFAALGILSLFFFGVGWLCRRFLLPRKGESPLATLAIALIAVFGGSGLMMLAGGAYHVIAGQTEAGVGLGVFGTVFASIGYLGTRLYSNRRRATK